MTSSRVQTAVPPSRALLNTWDEMRLPPRIKARLSTCGVSGGGEDASLGTCIGSGGTTGVADASPFSSASIASLIICVGVF